MHVIFVYHQQFLSVDFLDAEDFGKWTKANVSNPFAYFLDSPLGYIMNFSFQSDKKIVARCEFNNLFLKKVMESFGFKNFVVLSVNILHSAIL